MRIKLDAVTTLSIEALPSRGNNRRFWDITLQDGEKGISIIANEQEMIELKDSVIELLQEAG